MRHGEMCEPCGECQWCFARHAWIRKARERAQTIKRLAWALERVTSDLEVEISAAGPEEIRQHPVLRRHDRDATRARKVLASIRKAA